MLVTDLRWLKIVSSTIQDVDFDVHYYPSLSIGATIMVSKHCSITGVHDSVTFVTQYGAIATL